MVDVLFPPKYPYNYTLVKCVYDDGSICEVPYYMVERWINPGRNKSELRCLKALQRGLGSYAPDNLDELTKMTFHVRRDTWKDTRGNRRGSTIQANIGRLYHNGHRTINAMVDQLNEVGRLERYYQNYLRSMNAKPEFYGHVTKITRSDLDVYESGFSVRIRMVGFGTKDACKAYVANHLKELVGFVNEEFESTKPLTSMVGDLRLFKPVEVTVTNDICAVIHYEPKPGIEKLLNDAK